MYKKFDKQLKEINEEYRTTINFKKILLCSLPWLKLWIWMKQKNINKKHVYLK